MSRARRNLVINSNENKSLDLGINADNNSTKENQVIEHDIKPVDTVIISRKLKVLKNYVEVISYKIKKPSFLMISNNCYNNFQRKTINMMMNY